MQAVQNIRKRQAVLSEVGSAAVGIISVFLLGALIFGAKSGAAYITSSLSLCVSKVIPAVFPMMVMSNILIMSGGGAILEKIFGSAVKWLFGISPNASAAVISGFLCGFPVGASAAARLYGNGQISKAELCRLLTFINNPSASFVIFSVGGALLGSVKLGIIIYLGVIISAMLSGFLARVLMKGGKDELPKRAHTALPLPELLVSSVTSAISGVLNVCAYAAFFSAVVGILSDLLQNLGVPFRIRAVLFGFFELVGGVRALSDGGDLLVAAHSSAAVCSWSGISVLMQIVSVCRGTIGDEPFSFRPMIISKLFQAMICPLIVFFLLKLTHFDI